MSTPSEVIASVTNPRVKRLVRLRDRRDRDDEGVFIVEGYRAIRRMLDQQITPTELYLGRDWFQGENEASLIDDAARAGTRVIELGREAFAKCAYRDRPDGLLAVVAQWDHSLKWLAAQLPTTPFVLVVEAIEKPGNLGTILRSADAAGVNAVILCDPVTDLFNPNVVRSSTGVLFAVPVVVAESAEVRSFLRAQSIRTVATTPGARQRYTDADLTGPLAIVMGSEMHGLSDAWLAEADETVVIPMAGQADSLNVAAATLITLFEAVRQR
jgi:RNA methyltransferase, TrmH family